MENFMNRLLGLALTIGTMSFYLGAMKRDLEKVNASEETKESKQRLSFKKLALMKYSNQENLLNILPKELQNELAKYIMHDQPSVDYYLITDQLFHNNNKFPEKVKLFTELVADHSIDCSGIFEFNANKSLLATLFFPQHNIVVLDVKTGKIKRMIELKSHEFEDLSEVSFNDSNQFLCGILNDEDANKKIKIWDVLKGTCLFESDVLQEDDSVCHIAEKVLIAPENLKGLIKIFNLANGGMQIFETQMPEVKDIIGASQGNIFGVLGSENTLKIFNLENLQFITQHQLPLNIRSCNFSVDGQILHFWHDHQSGFHDFKTKRSFVSSANNDFKCSPDSKKVAITSSIAKEKNQHFTLMDIVTGDEKFFNIQCNTATGYTNSQIIWNWSPDSKKLFHYCIDDQNQSILNIANCNTNNGYLIKKSNDFYQVSWNSDGRTIHLFSDSGITTMPLYKKRLKNELAEISLWPAQLLKDIYEKEKKKEPIAPLIALHQESFNNFPERIKAYLQTKI